MTITRVWIEDGCIGCGLAKATQGIGGGLYEKIVFDEDGQLLTTTFMDYLIPSAMEIPDIEIHHLDQPSAPSPHPPSAPQRWKTRSAPSASNAMPCR